MTTNTQRVIYQVPDADGVPGPQQIWGTFASREDAEAKARKLRDSGIYAMADEVPDEDEVSE